MARMEPTDILLGLLSAAVSASWATTQVRLGRIERQLSDKVDRAELMALREEVQRGFSELRAEIRGEVAGVRSDLTQIALAVGAGRPGAEEG